MWVPFTAATMKFIACVGGPSWHHRSTGNTSTPVAPDYTNHRRERVGRMVRFFFRIWKMSGLVKSMCWWKTLVSGKSLLRSMPSHLHVDFRGANAPRDFDADGAPHDRFTPILRFQSCVTRLCKLKFESLSQKRKTNDSGSATLFCYLSLKYVPLYVSLCAYIHILYIYLFI